MQLDAADPDEALGDPSLKGVGVGPYGRMLWVTEESKQSAVRFELFNSLADSPFSRVCECA